MAERISKETRSRMMSGIRGRDTKPELLVRSGLHAAGLRFRLQGRGLPGRPDVVLRRWRVAVFAHGCFWHGHQGCPYFRIPKSRTEFWTEKIESNARRDGTAVKALLAAGWRVAVVWECALRNDPDRAIFELVQFVRSKERAYVEIEQLQ